MVEAIENGPHTICMNSLQDCFSSIVLIMKGRLGILSQGTTFACVNLLKFTFGKSCRYLLHYLQGPMMQMAQLPVT